MAALEAYIQHPDQHATDLSTTEAQYRPEEAETSLIPFFFPIPALISPTSSTFPFYIVVYFDNVDHSKDRYYLKVL